MGESVNEFALADKAFLEQRTKFRVEAIMKAKARESYLKRELAAVAADLNDASAGNFTRLVEKYVSTQIAEEFE